jgi:uncharacterized protein (TIGR03084 family)
MQTICADLQAEQEALEAILEGLDTAGWDTPTPAPGWMVRDQISHLGTTDRTATTAAAEPERFITEIATQERQARMARQLEIGRQLQGSALLAWWRSGRTTMLAVFRGLEPGQRIPWFGPAMSAVSFATARLMETWAHGQDIVDALGCERPVTERLQHVAHIGVQARPFSYRTCGQEPPTEAVRVELLSPAGALWTWGEADAGNRITGSALDFCLVVTQRRHPADTGLRLQGPLAQEWMHLAQAFAGPPGAGRQPGQFASPA